MKIEDNQLCHVINTSFWKHMVEKAKQIVRDYLNVRLGVNMFDELPTEIIERIFAFLSYEEKVDVLRVCKR